jgi:hypothetical protein
MLGRLQGCDFLLDFNLLRNERILQFLKLIDVEGASVGGLQSPPLVDFKLFRKLVQIESGASLTCPYRSR